jgi:hypothetical protein
MRKYKVMDPAAGGSFAVTAVQKFHHQYRYSEPRHPTTQWPTRRRASRWIRGWYASDVDSPTAANAPQMDPGNDTGYETTGYDSGSTSLASTVNQYVFENGTYFA